MKDLFGLESVFTSLIFPHSKTQKDPNESIMAAKQGVSMMHELYAMHVCMMHMLCNKYQSILQIRYNIHPSNLIPPTHVFNGEFLFLEFLVWASISIGDIEYRRPCQSFKAVKHRNSISRYKSLAQYLLAQDECSPNELLKYGLGLL